MSQWDDQRVNLTVIVTKPDSLTPTPRTHVVEEENWLLENIMAYVNKQTDTIFKKTLSESSHTKTLHTVWFITQWRQIPTAREWGSRWQLVAARGAALKAGSEGLSVVLGACRGGPLPAETSLWPKTATSYRASFWTHENTAKLAMFVWLLWIFWNLLLCFWGWVLCYVSYLPTQVLSLVLELLWCLAFFSERLYLLTQTRSWVDFSPLILWEYLKCENLEQSMSIMMPSPSQE